MSQWFSRSYTDRGTVRSINEDSVLDLSEQRLWLVADGMGGHAHGSYASELVSRAFVNYKNSTLPGVNKQRIVDRLMRCNSQLIKKAEIDQCGVIGSTVALLQASRNSVTCSWCGDSRIYRLRQGKLRQLTHDHSQQCAVEDRDRLKHPDAPPNASQVLTRAIGGREPLVLEHCWYSLHAGDSFLLCTDGLTKDVSDAEILGAMMVSPNGEHVVDALVQLYSARGARDNVGIVWISEASQYDGVTRDSSKQNGGTYYL